ncbi:MAG TPA: HAMP domain-containing sensor histidine kinase, partial [Anaeromyxobacteraceae bacterium]
MTPHPGWRARHRGRLFWRVWLSGLLLLGAVHLALAATGWALGGRAPVLRPDRAAEYAAALASARDPADLGAALSRAREAFGTEIAVYDGEALVAANAEPPPPPASSADRARLERGPVRLHRRRHAWAAPIPGSPGRYLVLVGPWAPFGAGRAAAFLGALFLALALASIPLARAIARPLERLTEAARRLGRGDLSARAHLRAPGEIGELARAFDEMAERVERLVLAERELLANVSHELRTPLSRIRVALDLAAEGDLEASRRWVREIGADLEELEQLIEGVLMAARLERGGEALPLRRERLAPADLVERAAERFRAGHPGRALEVEVAGSLPDLDADPALLRRALDNLLDNARKYSDDSAPVALRARAAGRAVEIEVRDRGIGIDAADLPRLFTPFFRTDR